MGLQNGLTASISNFAVKTTHLTGATTDLGILLSMFTKKEFRQNKEIRDKAKLISSILASYVLGAIIAAFIVNVFTFKIFYFVSMFIFIIVMYDMYHLYLLKYWAKRRDNRQINFSLKVNKLFNNRINKDKVEYL